MGHRGPGLSVAERADQPGPGGEQVAGSPSWSWHRDRPLGPVPWQVASWRLHPQAGAFVSGEGLVRSRDPTSLRLGREVLPPLRSAVCPKTRAWSAWFDGGQAPGAVTDAVTPPTHHLCTSAEMTPGRRWEEAGSAGTGVPTRTSAPAAQTCWTPSRRGAWPWPLRPPGHSLGCSRIWWHLVTEYGSPVMGPRRRQVRCRCG